MAKKITHRFSIETSGGVVTLTLNGGMCKRVDTQAVECRFTEMEAIRYMRGYVGFCQDIYGADKVSITYGVGVEFTI